MKTMTCNQLAGACDTEFHAATVEEMIEMAKAHGMEMVEKGDEAHIIAMESAKEKMGDPEAMENMLAMTKEKFDALPEDN